MPAKPYKNAPYGSSNSPYETDFGVSTAFGGGNTKIGFLKARQRRTFKKPIFIIRIAATGAFLSQKNSGSWQRQ
ncbi:hypothetical protein [Phormidium tenue]|uniref:Uncharacterized protein n=1 Tax=Phormidium tenue FACHB-1050 TaxID=2692857 RepID=A0ABR8C5K6_9CYAN|nr:hypothetical protein [Phormidium tenue]MBD2316008.1 hypothetical protein [Phormidium tenue FACHB-1050]